MRFETEIIQFSNDFKMDGLPLSEIQKEYLLKLKSGESVQTLVQSYLKQGTLVSFRELHNLLKGLTKLNYVTNASLVKAYKVSADSLVKKPNFFAKILGKSPLSATEGSESLIEQLDHMPFFRSIDKSILNLFKKHAKAVKVPTGIHITRTGDLTRDLFVLVTGDAQVVKIDEQANSPTKGKRISIAQLTAGSVFGEIGFFLNVARTADVIATKDCEIIRIKYDSQDFEPLVKSDRANTLKERFWVLHALTKSDFFKGLPDDCLDSLIFAGKIYPVDANTTLFKEGDHGASAYLVIQGEVVISRNGKSLNLMKQGACFGEIALMMTGGKRTATAVCQKSAMLLEIQQQDFYRLLSTQLALGVLLEKTAQAYFQSDQEKQFLKQISNPHQ